MARDALRELTEGLAEVCSSGDSEPLKDSQQPGDGSHSRAPARQQAACGGKGGEGKAEAGGGVGEAVVVVRLESSVGQGSGSRDAGDRVDLEDLGGLGS